MNREELKKGIFPVCNCKNEYTIEPHADGKVLYYGRCNHRHGFNLCRVDDIAFNALDILNTRADDMISRKEVIEAIDKAEHFSFSKMEIKELINAIGEAE